MTQQAAKELLDGSLPVLAEQLSSSIPNHSFAWQGDVLNFSFRARGFDIKGTLEITDTDAVLEVNLPFAARLFESTIRSKFERGLDAFLGGLPNSR